jgi:hypothetical protein
MKTVSLAWNTSQLLGAGGDSPTGERIPIEYHLLTGRELYDAKIISADRYSSGAAEWVFRGAPNFYSVSVVTRPFYSLPQELCLSFDCFSRTLEGQNIENRVIITGPPTDEVAFEFAALLSLFAREPIGLLGSRRIRNRPIFSRYPYEPPPREFGGARPPACPIDSVELTAIIRGLGQSTNQATIDAALAATKLYYAGLSIARFDPSIAYVSLVSAIECLAGYHYRKHQFAFHDVGESEGLSLTLDKLSVLAGGNSLVEQLKNKLTKRENFSTKKFYFLVADFLPDDFWTTPDDLYQVPSLGSPDSKAGLGKALKAVYTARSKYVHAGTPFPAHVEFGLNKSVPVQVAMASLDIPRNGTKKTVPAFIWFERVTHLVIKEYLRRSFAPEIVQAREENAEEKARIHDVIRNLANNIRESLRKLTSWTRPFLGMAIINPFAPNKEWADEEATVIALRDSGLIGTTDPAITGASWLKNREVGEAVGEFFFGAAANPFRGNDLLLPKGWDEIFTEIDEPDPPPPVAS